MRFPGCETPEPVLSPGRSRLSPAAQSGGGEGVTPGGRAEGGELCAPGGSDSKRRAAPGAVRPRVSLCAPCALPPRPHGASLSLHRRPAAFRLPGPEPHGRLPSQSQHPDQHPGGGARLWPQLAARAALPRPGSRLPPLVLRAADGGGSGAWLAGLGPHCQYILPTYPSIWLGDVCSHLFLAGNNHSVCDVSTAASYKTLHGPLAYCVNDIQRGCNCPVRDSFYYVLCCRSVCILANFGLQQKSCCIILCLHSDDSLWGEHFPQLPGMERMWQQCSNQSSD